MIKICLTHYTKSIHVKTLGAGIHTHTHIKTLWKKAIKKTSLALAFGWCVTGFKRY